MSKYLRVILLAFLAFSSAARASDDDWRVAKSTTQVTYSLDLDVWSDVHVGEVIPNKAWLSTGPRGRLQLTRGVETISLQPNTLASITTSGFFTRKTEILQQAGALDLEIEKRSQPHTTVQTPFLAAVVKGTIFHVTVGKRKASVTVDRGLVQVTSFSSGQRSDVGPNQSATVDRKLGMTVMGAVMPSIVTVAKSLPRLPAIDEPKAAKATPTADDKPGVGVGGSGKSAKSNSGNGNNGGGSGNGNNSSGNGNGNNGNGNGNGGASGNGNNGNSGNGNGNGGGNGNGNNGNGNGNGGANGNGNSGNGNGNGNNGNGKGNNK